MNKFNLSKQLIYKLFLSFALLVLSLVSAKANDVYYEQCSSLSDIVDGQTYLLVISDGKTHYAVRSNSANCYPITMESDNTIKNPVNSAQWKFSGDKHKSLQVDTERTFHLRYPLVML